MANAVQYPRYNDWTIRWVEFIKDCQDIGSDLRLDWESMNCFQFCGMGAEAITGHNPYDEFQEEGHSVLAAVKNLKRRGFDTLDQLIRSLYPEVAVGMCQQGDWVLIPANWQVDESIARVMPHGIALADPPHYWCVTPEGLGRGDLYANGKTAFAVGRVV